MNVLHLVPTFAPGGRREAVTSLIRRLPALGVGCAIGCARALGCPPEDVAEFTGAVDVFGSRSALDAGAARRLRDVCRGRRIDVIHSHDASAQLLAVLAGLRRPRPRHLMTFHRSLGIESATWRDRLRNTLAGTRTDAVVTGSRERREHFLRENRVPPRKVVRIPLGIDLDRFRPNPDARATLRRELGIGPDVLVLGAVGHFGPEKGIDIVLRGFVALAGRGSLPPLALVVVGDGTESQREEMRRLVPDEVSGSVTFAGFRCEVQRWFQAFDVFVHAPRMESFGLVLAEAMAAGLPVVATRVGGILDIVRDGRTGLLVNPDSPDELADALGRLALDKGLRHGFGAAGRDVARAEYNVDLYARRYARLYRDLLDGRSPAGIDEETGEVRLDVHQP